jgi:methionyl-tRNA formyltransferase
LTANPIAQFALDRALPLLRTANINAEALPPADLMIVIAFGQKIVERQVHHARLGSINLHA